MKKFISLMLAAVMALSCAVLVGAEAFKPNGDQPSELQITVKKAEADAVVKDGLIGADEYERYEVITDPENEENDLYICFGTSDYYEQAYNMCSTMEYYFSWDETHGFNFAVKYKPTEIIQENSEGADPAKPTDDFCCQTAINFVGYTDIFRDEAGYYNMLYYSVAKRTTDGEYIEGHWAQLGPTGEYNPEAEQDYIINYSDDGYVTCEWSVPFEKIGVSGEVGTNVYFSIGATAGDRVEEGENGFDKFYAISFGDYGFGSKMTEDKHMATGIISDEAIGGAWESPFADVKDGDWFYSYVEYVNKKGLMTGKSDTEFSPNAGMTRAELVTVLWRMEGKPEVPYTDKFTDIPEGEWFTSPVLWAAENEIVKGFEDGTYMPGEGLTREQLATILYRYTQSKGVDVTPKGDVTGFPDGASVQSWAVDALNWAVGASLITGKPGANEDEVILAPQAPTTRAEIATIMMRYGA